MKRQHGGLLFLVTATVLLLGFMSCKEEEPRRGTDILSFVVNGKNGAIDAKNDQISVVLPAGTNLKTLAPEITLSGGAKVLPVSGDTVDLSNPVTYTVTAESGTVRQFIVTVTAEDPAVVLDKIQVTVFPFKTVYDIDEPLDYSGLVVIGTYSNGSTAELFNYDVTGYSSATAGAKPVTVAAGGKNASFVVLVRAAVTLQAIKVIELPTVEYDIGDVLDLRGLVVQGAYSDGSVKNILNYTIAPTTLDTSKSGKTTFTVTAADGAKPTAAFDVRVKEAVTLQAIKVVNLPQTELNIGQLSNFDGLMVQGVFSDGSMKNILNYTIAPASVDTSKSGKTTYTVTAADGAKPTATFDVLVKATDAQLVSFAITKEPTQTTYMLNEALNLNGMEVTKTYSDGSSVVTSAVGYSATGYASTTMGKQTLRISSGNMYDTFEVTVNTLTGIEVTKLPTKTEYIQGETVSLNGMEVTETYADGTTNVIISGYTYNSEVTQAMATGKEIRTYTVYSSYNNALYDTFEITTTPTEKELTLTIGLLGDREDMKFFGLPDPLVLSWTGQPDKDGNLTIPTTMIIGTDISPYTGGLWNYNDPASTHNGNSYWSVDGDTPYVWNLNNDNQWGSRSTRSGHYLYNQNIITINAKDFTLERPHTLTFTGQIGSFRYTKSIEFTVVK